MTLQMRNVTVDCADPKALATWWAEALGGTVVAEYPGYVFIQAGSTGMGFQQIEQARLGKNSVHVDFAADDRTAEVARLASLGATEIDEHTVPGLTWTVLRDPEGNEFCVSGNPALQTT